MPTKYQINITNNNSDNTNYLVLCAVPEASDEMGKGWTNVWAKTPGVGKKGGNTQINFTDETFAVCGMAPQELGPRVNISTSQSVSVNLGPSDAGAVSAAIIDSGLLFDSDPAPTKVQAGFEIHTKVWTNAQYSTAFCGMGKTQPYSNPSKVIPVATWTAKSSENYIIYPKIQYFVSTGEYSSGDIVDVATLGQVATIDFTGKKETVAQVTQKDDGTFAPVTYSFRT
ncbi:hypothetical protein KCU65_g2619, partial [Aureobasidium melanogenum]